MEFLRIVCVSLTGIVISKAEVPLESTQPDRVCKQTTAMVHGLCQQLHRQQAGVVRGGRLSAREYISDDSGIVRFAEPGLAWRQKFLDMISRAFADAGVPASIHLQNDADAAALSEYEFAAGEGEDPLIFIRCDVGVGAEKRVE